MTEWEKKKKMLKTAKVINIVYLITLTAILISATITLLQNVAAGGVEIFNYHADFYRLMAWIFIATYIIALARKNSYGRFVQRLIHSFYLRILLFWWACAMTWFLLPVSIGCILLLLLNNKICKAYTILYLDKKGEFLNNY